MFHALCSKSRGLTLIETIIYAALLSILIGLILGVVFQITEGSKRLNSKVFVEEEASFLLRKIEWAVGGASLVNTPAASATSTTLSVETASAPPSENPIVFAMDSGNLTITRGNGSPVVLNSTRVTVQSVEFEHIATSGEKPPGVSVHITLGGQNPADSRSYETTIYLRQ